ncbi:MAG: hypothetical protein Tp162SUR384061_7 [Prokaryotic dsDNA virus sp.]|jgi:hypothetical protein|nr:MAG: hypothetical protein Tp162SUR384061_7 [Prokaryotic dsDNA virus sp.]|tara:strand:- start:1128 stop:1652 length:525 start_codon:yes stop_codon:yes gene_type:complete
MAGKIVQIATQNITSPTATVTLTGIDDTSTHIVTFHTLTTSNDTKNPRFRVTKASDSSADSTSNYDFATRSFRTDTGYNNGANENNSSFSIGNIGTGTQEVANGIIYLYQFADSSHPSYMRIEANYRHSTSSVLFGQFGGGVHTVNQANNGVQFFENSGDTITGVFTLYKVVAS